MDQSAFRNTPELLQRKIISPSAANPESSEIMLEGSGVKTKSHSRWVRPEQIQQKHFQPPLATSF
jgi:hypothetical protein